jgi:hypothetical protein
VCCPFAVECGVLCVGRRTLPGADRFPGVNYSQKPIFANFGYLPDFAKISFCECFWFSGLRKFDFRQVASRKTKNQGD